VLVFGHVQQHRIGCYLPDGSFGSDSQYTVARQLHAPGLLRNIRQDGTLISGMSLDMPWIGRSTNVKDDGEVGGQTSGFWPELGWP
jgi:hypothetical protein